MNRFLQIFFIVKNLHKVFWSVLSALKQRAIKILRKMYFFFLSRIDRYEEKINSHKLDYDYILTPIDGNIFLLTNLEYKLYSNSGLINQKIFFDYHTYGYGSDTLNKFLIQHFVKEGDIVIDIGAHIGIYSLFLSKLVGNHGKVLCFEPHNDISKSLKNNFILNGCHNFEIYNFGLGDKDHQLNFNSVFSDSFFEGTVNSSFILNEKISSDYFSGKFEKIKTKVFKLDSVLAGEKIKFVKIDTEGFELNILKGMKKTIEKDNPIIIFEYHTKRLQYLDIKIKMFDELLKKHYGVFKIFIDGKTNNIAFKKFSFDTDDEYSGDLFCLPKNLIDSHRGYKNTENFSNKV
jgi:FkbM family methyltransferase